MLLIFSLGIEVSEAYGSIWYIFGDTITLNRSMENGLSDLTKKIKAWKPLVGKSKEITGQKLDAFLQENATIYYETRKDFKVDQFTNFGEDLKDLYVSTICLIENVIIQRIATRV